MNEFDSHPEEPAETAEFWRLAQAYCNGTPSPEERERLEAILWSSLELRDRFLNYAGLHAELRSETRSFDPPAIPPAASAADPALPAVATSTDLLPGSLFSSAEACPLSDGEYPSAGGVSGVLLSLFRPPLVFVTLLIMLSCSVFATHQYLRSQFPSGHQSLATSGDRKLEVPSVHLLSGTVKLMLPDIGYVIIDGPAEFDMLDPMRARLTKGRIKMHVTEETGHGFVVETPFGNIVDLGTEFGLDVPTQGEASVVVFDGAVDLQIPRSGENPDFSHVERLVRGEGLAFGEDGQLNRIMSIITGSAATFQQRREPMDAEHVPVIVQVTDNRQTTETKKFYEIVTGGLREDAQAYVDRPEHEWNGITSDGMPSYLIGADYVKPFNEDRLQKGLQIEVTLARPARLFVFFDNRVKPPQWLHEGFRKTKDKIGLDLGKWKSKRMFRYQRADGPGLSIDDRFTVWERVIKEPGVVALGSHEGRVTSTSAMYGIAAVALEPAAQPDQANVSR